MTTTLRSRNGHAPVITRSRNGHALVTAHLVPPPPEKTARRWQRQYSNRLRITDLVIVCASVLFAQVVRFGESAITSGYPGQLMTLFSVLFAALWLSSIAVFHTRSPRIIGAGVDEYRRLTSASFWTFGIIAMATLLAKIDVARGYLAIALPLGT
ncbi:MAG TPA: sugar transferase, partial [Mycobacterium sp.]|nr:sugar transferase [Mycobacterium sp.]